MEIGSTLLLPVLFLVFVMEIDSILYRRIMLSTPLPIKRMIYFMVSVGMSKCHLSIGVGEDITIKVLLGKNGSHLQ